jgi:hypothetical protein
VKAVIFGLAIGLAIAACAQGPGTQRPLWDRDSEKKHEITALWAQIRGWRHDAHMDVEPPQALIQSLLRLTVRQAGGVCPDSHVPPASCGDICGLGDAICENAENICVIAAELNGDGWAREKCNSAKASCREAKQRCCDCDDEAVKALSPAVTPVTP